MSDATTHPLMAFQDGEGIDPADFESMESLLRQRWIQECGPGPATQLAALIKNDTTADFIGGGDGQPGLEDSAYELIEQLFVPRAGQLFTAPETKVFQSYPSRFMFFEDSALPWGYLAMPGSVTLTAPSASLPAVNPRWDTLELNISTADGASESRDFEDASSRTLSTTTPNKRIDTTYTAAWKVGSEAALPDFPALTSGRRRLISLKRQLGEGGTVNKADFALHVYPMRVAIEDVYGHEAFIGTAGRWTTNTAGGLLRASASTGDYVVFRSRKMHPGCRLLAVGVSSSLWTGTEFVSKLRRATYNSSGVLGTVTFVDFDTDIQPNGLHYMGERDWTVNGGLAAGTQCAFPIWGNGYPYGPLFSSDDAIASPVASSHLELAITVDSAPDVDEVLNFVRFIYAY